MAFKGFPVGKALSYAVAQLAGAIAGAVTVLACFGPAITTFELGKNLVRGSAAGIASAPGCMFLSLTRTITLPYTLRPIPTGCMFLSPL